MRVLHLETGTHLYGGALQTLLLVEGLESRGIEDFLVVPKDSEVEEEARRRALPVRAIPFGGEIDLSFPFRFRRLIREVAPDLVHLHSRRGADTLGALGARSAGVPVVLTRRVDNPEPLWAVAAKYRLYDRVIAISQAIQSVLLNQGVPRGKVCCVRSAFDGRTMEAPWEREAFQEEFDLGPRDRTVGMAAQFIPRKGHRTLLEAIPAILKEHPRTRFLLFGRGPMAEEITRAATEGGFGESVRFPGFRQDLTGILPCLDVLVHPASMEGLGIILLQASAAGVPVVGSSAGGIPEAVADGETGLLIPPGDSQALAKAASALLSEPERARAMGEAGRRRVRDAFSVDRMVEGNLSVYRDLLKLGPEADLHDPS